MPVRRPSIARRASRAADPWPPLLGWIATSTLLAVVVLLFLAALLASAAPAATEQLQRIAADQGAQVLDSRTQVDAKGRRYGWARLRIASERLELLRAALRPLGTLAGDQSDAEDERSEYDGLRRRVQVLQLHQARLEAVLGGDHRLRGSDVLYIQDRLFRAGADQQDLLQRQDDLRARAADSLVRVTLYEPYAALPGAAVPARSPVTPALRFRSSLARARSEYGLLADQSATGAAYLLAYLPLVVAGLLAAAAALWLLRRPLLAAGRLVRLLAAAWLARRRQEAG